MSECVRTRTVTIQCTEYLLFCVLRGAFVFASEQVGRKEWDGGMHSCPVHRKVNVLAKHASGAGMLRNRQ